MKLQQFHKSVESAKKQIARWRKDFRSSFSQDYGGYTVTSIKLAKKGAYGGENKKTATGRRLYDIHLRKKRNK